MRCTLRHILSLATAVAVALSVGACGTDPSSEIADTAVSTDSPTATIDTTSLFPEDGQATDVSELKAAIDGAPAYASVTVTQTVAIVDSDGNPIDTSPYIVKFDVSGDVLRSSSSYNAFGSTWDMYVEGDKAAHRIGTNVYGGTPEELSLEEITSVEAFVENKVGSFDDICACAREVLVSTDGTNTTYVVHVDPESFCDMDETYAEMRDADYPLTEKTCAYTFDTDGRLSLITYTETFTPASGASTIPGTITFTDYDATTVEAMPEANKSASDLTF